MKKLRDGSGHIAKVTLFNIDHTWYESFWCGDQPVLYLVLAGLIRLVFVLSRSARKLCFGPRFG